MAVFKNSILTKINIGLPYSPRFFASVVPSSNIVNEGQSVTFSVTTRNVYDDAILYWDNVGTTNGFDFVGGNNSGQFTVSNNQANVTLTLVNDITTEGFETIIFNVRQGNVSGPILATANTVNVVDTSITLVVNGSVTPSTELVSEGQAVTFNVTTGNIFDGTVIYWTNAGNTTSSDFVEGVNSGSFTINSNAGSFSLNLVADRTTEGIETIIPQIRIGSPSGNIIATSNVVYVSDTSLTPIPTYSIIESTSSVNEGQSVTYNVYTSNVDNGTVLYWTNSGTSTTSDFSGGTNSGNFSINSNTGSFSVTTLEDYTTEGSETIIIRLRTDSISGNIVATANTVTINDTSLTQIPTYDVVPTSTLISEGQAVTFNITTSNVASGTTLYWTNNGSTNASDFTEGVNNGSVQIISGAGSVTFTLVEDYTTEGPEDIIFNLRANSISGTILATASTVTVSDTSITLIPTYEAIPTTTSVNEGSSVTFNVNTSNVFNNTTLYWTNSGTTTGPDFSGGNNSGSFTIRGNTGNVTLSLVADETTEGPETIIFRVRTGSTSGSIVATADTVTVNDTSITLIPIYQVSPNVATLNEGQSVRFTVNTANVPNGNVVYWTNAGNTGIGDFIEGVNSGSFSISSNTGSVTLTLRNDLITEGDETIILQIRNNSTSGPIVATSSTVTIIDTSLSQPSYSLSANTVALNEGQEVFFTINTANVADGTTLYWTNGGNTNATDFVSLSNSGSFTIRGNTGNVSISLREDLTTEGTENILFQVRTVSTSGNIVANTVVLVYDTSTADPPVVEYLAVGGGGGGGSQSYSSVASPSGCGGGGGGGGFACGYSCDNSPLTPGATYVVTIGAGGLGAIYYGCCATSTTYGSPGSSSCITGISPATGLQPAGGDVIALGGGGGGSKCGGGTTGCKRCGPGDSGASGGGGAGGPDCQQSPTFCAPLGGSGSFGYDGQRQGYPGGGGPPSINGKGGGGAGQPGYTLGLAPSSDQPPNGSLDGNYAGPGGSGRCWQGTGQYYAGGGGGGAGVAVFYAYGRASCGGGGAGGQVCQVPTPTSRFCFKLADPGSINTGGGGGGGSGHTCSLCGACYACGGCGGSGIVIIKYLGPQRATGGTVCCLGGYTCHIFTSSGSLVVDS